MEQATKTIEIDVPVRRAYDQWTQFEEFPKFMGGVEQVQQIDDTHLHWVAKVGGKREEWDAEIIEQTPDRSIRWQQIGGDAENAGSVLFEPIDATRTRLTLNIAYKPEGLVEKAGDALGFMDRQLEKDLENFRQFIEERGTETGAWRGDVSGGQRQDAQGSTLSGSQAAPLPEESTRGVV